MRKKDHEEIKEHMEQSAVALVKAHGRLKEVAMLRNAAAERLEKVKKQHTSALSKEQRCMKILENLLFELQGI